MTISIKAMATVNGDMDKPKQNTAGYNYIGHLKHLKLATSEVNYLQVLIIDLMVYCCCFYDY